MLRSANRCKGMSEIWAIASAFPSFLIFIAFFGIPSCHIWLFGRKPLFSLTGIYFSQVCMTVLVVEGEEGL